MRLFEIVLQVGVAVLIAAVAALAALCVIGFFDSWCERRSLIREAEKPVGPPSSTPAFITGSRVYGQITKESDLDLVIFADDATTELLKLHGGGMPIRFGVLNIIALNNMREFNAWKSAKQVCVDKAKELKRGLTHDEAVKIHEQELKIAKVKKYIGQSGPA